ncbi:putative Fe-S cluster assembly protein SufT [Paralcaligenes ginsengisoli]
MDNRMHEVELTRDCAAVKVPWGSPITLDEGSVAQITQQLGGSYTVLVGGNLYRIDGSDADALGLEPVAAEAGAAAEGPATAESVEQAAWSQLATCYDPEIPIDIVNLGLVYSCVVKPIAEGRFRIDISMTLTAPGCGMGTLLADEARAKLLAIHGVDEVKVDLVWDPPWGREMISEAARLEMGLF